LSIILTANHQPDTKTLMHTSVRYKNLPVEMN